MNDQQKNKPLQCPAECPPAAHNPEISKPLATDGAYPHELPSALPNDPPAVKKSPAEYTRPSDSHK